MSAFDKDRYLRLRESAVWNQEFWRGHFQDLSRNQRAVSGGAWGYSWSSCPGGAVFDMAPGGFLATAATATIVDTTAPFSVEVLQLGTSRTGVRFMRQLPGDGGLACDVLGNNLYVQTYTAAGASARRMYTAALPALTSDHFILTLGADAASSFAWRNGVPAANTFTAGAAAVGSNASLWTCYGYRGHVLTRVYPMALTNADAAAIYGAAHSLTGGEV